MDGHEAAAPAPLDVRWGYESLQSAQHLTTITIATSDGAGEMLEPIGG